MITATTINDSIRDHLRAAGVNMARIRIHTHEVNGAWYSTVYGARSEALASALADYRPNAAEVSRNGFDSVSILQTRD